MKLPSLPTSNVGMLPRVLEKLEKNVLDMQEKPEEVTNKQRFVAYAVASVGALVFGVLDLVANTVLIAVKAVPVLLNVTVGRLTGLSKYVTSPALSGDDFVAHFDNIRRTLLIQLNAALVLTMLAKPQMVVTIARDVKLLPVVDSSAAVGGKDLAGKQDAPVGVVATTKA